MKITMTPSDPSLAEWWYDSRKESETIKFNPLAPSSFEVLRERLSKASRRDFFWISVPPRGTKIHVFIVNFGLNGGVRLECVLQIFGINLWCS